MFHFIRKIKTKYIFLILLLFVFVGYTVFAFFTEDTKENLDFNSAKTITINDTGLSFKIKTTASTVSELLKEKNISTNDHDLTIPAEDTTLFDGANIEIKRAQKITIEVDGKKLENFTFQNNVGKIIFENNLSLGPLDIVYPPASSAPEKNKNIIITRINEEKKIIPEDIDFKIIYNNDSKLGWREEKITTTGEKGIIEVKYKITYKNGKEVSRVALEKNITKDPITQIVTRGTYMKLGKADRGDATYYNSSWGELNASRTIPRGEYAKVTNLDNGKSVIVKINDFGPISKERVIDLSYKSFSKIGDLWRGVLHNVKVEEILN